MPKIRNKKEQEKELVSDAVAIRIDEIINIILINPTCLNTKKHDKIVKEISKKYSISRRQSQRYLSKAFAQLRAMTKEDTKKNFESALIERLSLLQRIREGSGDHRTELLALKDIAELQNLYPDKSIKLNQTISLKDVNLNSLTDDQLSKLKIMLVQGVPLKDALLHIGVIIT